LASDESPQLCSIPGQLQHHRTPSKRQRASLLTTERESDSRRCGRKSETRTEHRIKLQRAATQLHPSTWDDSPTIPHFSCRSKKHFHVDSHAFVKTQSTTQPRAPICRLIGPPAPTPRQSRTLLPPSRPAQQPKIHSGACAFRNQIDRFANNQICLQI
jgi:hypothetical protein